MTISEWRAIKERVRSARSILDNEAFTQMLEVVAKASPLWTQTLKYGVEATDGDRSRFLGKIEGYQECLANFGLLGEFASKPKEVQARYDSNEE